jgi:hypothetical protein
MKNTTTTTTKIQYEKGGEKIAREKTLENQRKGGDARTHATRGTTTTTAAFFLQNGFCLRPNERMMKRAGAGRYILWNGEIAAHYAE